MSSNDHVENAQKALDHILSLPNLDSLRGEPRKIIDAIDEYSESVHLRMNVGPKKGDVVLKHIREKQPTVMIELGGYIGYSAILFGNEIHSNNKELCKNGNRGKYYSFELSEDFAKISRQLIDLAGLSDTVEVIVGPAGRNLPPFQRKLTEKFKEFTSADMIFIDHWKDLYVADLRVLESCGLVCPGTVIIADNILYPGAPGYVDYVQGSPQERFEHNMKNINPSNKECNGRWNLIYESETVPVKEGVRGHDDALEVTKCINLLSG